MKRVDKDTKIPAYLRKAVDSAVAYAKLENVSDSIELAVFNAAGENVDGITLSFGDGNALGECVGHALKHLKDYYEPQMASGDHHAYLIQYNNGVVKVLNMFRYFTA